MTVARPTPIPVEHPPYRNRSGRRGTVLVRMLRTTDPKDIGILYLCTTFGFFLAGGAMALLIRAELAWPGQQFLSDE